MAVAAEGEPVRRADSPEIVVARLEHGEVNARDVTGLRRIREIEDVEPAPGADKRLVRPSPAARQRLGAVMAGVVSSHGIQPFLTKYRSFGQLRHVV